MCFLCVFLAHLCVWTPQEAYCDLGWRIVAYSLHCDRLLWQMRKSWLNFQLESPSRGFTYRVMEGIKFSQPEAWCYDDLEWRGSIEREWQIIVCSIHIVTSLFTTRQQQKRPELIQFPKFTCFHGQILIVKQKKGDRNHFQLKIVLPLVAFFWIRCFSPIFPWASRA